MSEHGSHVDRTGRHRYVLHSVWTLDAGQHEVFDVLADVFSYPSWWPEFKSARRIDADHGELSVRSRLPFTHHFVLRRDVEDRERGVLRAFASGDIEGTVEWRVEPLTMEQTRVVFTEDVVLARSAASLMDRFIRRLLEWNHRIAMQSGAKCLERHLQADAGQLGR